VISVLQPTCRLKKRKNICRNSDSSCLPQGLKTVIQPLMMVARAGSVPLPADERVSGRTNANSSNKADFSCQRIKLVGKRQLAAALQHELTFSNHVHEFDAGQDISGGPK